jgi:hypothetical protein
VYKGKVLDRVCEVLKKSVVVRLFMADVYKSEELSVRIYLNEFKKAGEGEESAGVGDLRVF